jgi:hypothetical protein
VDGPADSAVRRVKLPEAIPGSRPLFFLLQVENAFRARGAMLIPCSGKICVAGTKVNLACLPVDMRCKIGSLSSEFGNTANAVFSRSRV